MHKLCKQNQENTSYKALNRRYLKQFLGDLMAEKEEKPIKQDSNSFLSHTHKAKNYHNYQETHHKQA